MFNLLLSPFKFVCFLNLRTVFSTWLFFSLYFSAEVFYSFIMSIFSYNFLNIAIIVDLESLSANSNIWAISEFVSSWLSFCVRVTFSYLSSDFGRYERYIVKGLDSVMFLWLILSFCFSRQLTWLNTNSELCLSCSWQQVKSLFSLF